MFVDQCAQQYSQPFLLVIPQDTEEGGVILISEASKHRHLL
jgi:hypothetical protein